MVSGEKVPHCKNRKIGMMGGTFNPIHLGHLLAAESALEAFSLEQVIFVPAGNPPHKRGQKLTDKMDRYHMTVLATASNAKFTVSRYEIDKEEYSYSVDTVRHFKAKFPDAEIYFILGADSLLSIMEWKDPEVLLKSCRFIGVTRPGYYSDVLVKKIEELRKNFHANLYFVEIPAMDISSTDIKKRVKEGRSIKYMVDEKVEQYIKDHRLYIEE